MISTPLRVLTLSLMLCLAVAAIPSNGLETVENVRAKLDDKDFVVVPWEGTVLHNPNFKARIADLTKFPVLAGADVQFFMARITVYPGKTFPTHYHPRASEALTVERGAIRVTLRMENGKAVVNKIYPGQSTIFPQGLPHQIDCISKDECLLAATLNSAAPGNVFI